MSTKTTAELVPGDRIIFPDVNERRIVLPISEEHPGTTITVQDVRPWMLTAGPYAGQQARRGRRNTGLPLFEIVLSEADTTRLGGRPSATAEQAWQVA